MLDDYQVITAPPVQRLVAALIEHLPPSFHLVIATRAEPPLPIAQLRARGQVHELRADQLRFDTGEAAAFLTEVMGPALTEAASATLAARTEGWIAGLQLAALALRDQPDPALFVRDFEGSHRYVLDYLMAEVLDRQPAHIQTFLSRTAVLERLCGPLCDAVLGLTTDGGEAAPDDPTANSAGASPSQRLLEQLERADLFLIPLDDEWVWYRYHHLFADALRHRLRSRQPTWATEAHRRASAWYAGQGLLVEAVRHALAANATEQAADLIERASLTLLQRSELPMLRAWLEALPASVVRSRPWLGLRYAWLPRFNGQLEASAAWLHDAERAGQAAVSEAMSRAFRGEVAALRATLVAAQGDLARTIDLAQTALAALPTEDVLTRGTVAISLGIACAQNGAGESASRAFGEARAIYQAVNNLYGTMLTTHGLGLVAILHGRPRAAGTLYEETLRDAERAGQSGAPILGLAHLGLAELAYEWNDKLAVGRRIEAVARARALKLLP